MQQRQQRAFPKPTANAWLWSLIDGFFCSVPGTEIGELYIVAGSNRLDDGGVKVFVKEKLVHPDYGPVYNDYDIALLYVSARKLQSILHTFDLVLAAR